MCKRIWVISGSWYSCWNGLILTGGPFRLKIIYLLCFIVQSIAFSMPIFMTTWILQSSLFVSSQLSAFISCLGIGEFLSLRSSALCSPFTFIAISPSTSVSPQVFALMRHWHAPIIYLKYQAFLWVHYWNESTTCPL